MNDKRPARAFRAETVLRSSFPFFRDESKVTDASRVMARDM